MIRTFYSRSTWSFSLGLLAFLLLWLAACGPSGGPVDETAPANEAGEAATAVANAPARPDLFSPNPAATGNDSLNEVVGSSSDGANYDALGIEVGLLPDGRPYRGNPDAPVVIEEFSDFQCPFCARFSLQTLPSLNNNQIAAGDVLLVFYDFPLTSIHPQAEAAANAARCAADQSAVAYWEMHDLLFERMQEWGNRNADDIFIGYAAELGLDTTLFSDCVTNQTHLEAVRADVELGFSRGVSSTPSFFINGQPLIGAQPVEVFDQAIATVLNGGEIASNQPTQPTPPPTPTPIPISDEGIAARLGDPNAPYTIVEFTDFGCAACARHAADTLPKLTELLIESGQVQYILKEFTGATPPEAQSAAVAARCAGEQEAYWPMHEALFATQEVWVGDGDTADAYFADLAADLELDTAVFSDCLVSGKFDEAIQAAYDEGQTIDVGALPFFFIEGYPLSGAEPNSLARALGLPMDVPTAGAYSLGDPNAPITIVEYTDYQCPFCTRHFAETLPLLKQNFIDTGQVFYVIKDFPLTNIHPQAVAAAAAARCAGEQEAYWPMHDALFTSQGAWSGQSDPTELFVGLATDLGLDGDDLRACLASGVMETAVLADLAEGSSFGVSGTPAFFINGFLVSGALPYADFERGLNGILAELEQE